MQKLNIDKWDRKSQFNFFKDYENPFYNICTEVNITRLLKYTEDKHIPFSIASLFISLKVVNEYDPFRYRIRNDDVMIYDCIHGGQTVLNPDKTFSFCYFEYYDDFNRFKKNAQFVLEKHRENKGKLDPRTDQDDLIHYSTLPWIKFTSISHARKFSRRDSIPKIVFGKYFKVGDTFKMPFSIEVHHALIDGYHVAKYLEQFQDYLHSPDLILA
jgi:chloramphenicol O-acetyltransferase type A